MMIKTAKSSSSRGEDAWILTLVLSFFILLDGIVFLLLALGVERDTVLRVTGTSWESILLSMPGVAKYITNLTLVIGLTLVGFSLMILASSITGYRKGELWAWLLSWYLPLYFLIAGIITYNEGANISIEEYTVVILSVFFVISLVAQLGSIRFFFPRLRNNRAKKKIS